MKLTFCGAAGTTTGSQHLLEVNGKRILLDCGLYQGRRQDAYEVNCGFPHFAPESIDCVVLSHAHIDHSGNLPNLAKKGFRGNIYATDATRDLCQIMLADSARIQTHDIEWLNKHRVREGLEPVEPLYSEYDAEQCLRLFVTVNYDRSMLIADGVMLTFLDAGHILGSAQVLLEVKDQDDGKTKRFLFSGDVGRSDNEILRDPVAAENIDFVLMESTYGGRMHEEPPHSDDQIEKIFQAALKRGGKILIPAFAVERTQELLVVIHRLMDEGRLPEIPVFVDSPMAVSATETYRLHPECFNKEVYETLFEKQNPFGFENLTLVRSVKGSMALNELKGRAIIIAASGMCEAGRILHHLKNLLGDPKTTVLFVGFCAEHTLGRRIREGDPEVSIFGKRHAVRAHVEAVDSFSGHADHGELLAWFGRMSGPKSKVWLVHGEAEHSVALQAALAEVHSGEIAVAELGKTVVF